MPAAVGAGSTVPSGGLQHRAHLQGPPAPGYTCLHFQGVKVVFFLLFLACTQNREQPSAGGIGSVLGDRALGGGGAGGAPRIPPAPRGY